MGYCPILSFKSVWDWDGCTLELEDEPLPELLELHPAIDAANMVPANSIDKAARFSFWFPSIFLTVCGDRREAVPFGMSPF